MLREFQGIIDGNGLARFDHGSVHSFLSGPTAQQRRYPFWAIVDSQIASEILKELMFGSRQRALRMLEESAVCIGTADLRSRHLAKLIGSMDDSCPKLWPHRPAATAILSEIAYGRRRRAF